MQQQWTRLTSSSNRHQTVLFLLALVIPLLAWFNRSKAPNQAAFPLLSEDGLKNVLHGKEFLIVGGTDGVGGALAHSLVRRGALITVTGSSLHTSKYLPKGVDFIKSNVSTMRGAQELAGHLLRGRQFDTVVFCGGFVPRPILMGSGEGGGEEDLTSSYLSRFIVLTELVRNHALMGRKRVYVLAYPGDDPMLSAFEDMSFDWSHYKEIPHHLNTVLFNDAMVKEAARRYPDIRVFGVNPGFISRGAATDLQLHARHGIFATAMEKLAGLVMKSPEKYVEKILIQIVASPELHMFNGEYISDKFELLPPKRWFSVEKNRVLVWENSEKLVYQALG